MRSPGRTIGALLGLVLAVLSSGCGGRGAPPGRLVGPIFTRGEERFRIALPGRPWQPARAADSDVAFVHSQRDALMAVNAVCRGHSDPPLGVLISDLLLGTTEREYLLEEDTILDGRAARHVVVAARLDGVPLIYDLYVLKKDGCVYDLALISAPADYDAVADEFVDVVAGFRALGAAG